MRRSAVRAIGLGSFDISLAGLAVFAAGVDVSMFARCPVAEQVRLVARGVLLLLLLMLNFLTTAYAISLRLVEPDADWLPWALEWLATLLISGLWALVFFNLYRFLVSMVSHSERLSIGGGQLRRLIVFAVLALMLAAANAVGVAIWLARDDIRSEPDETRAAAPTRAQDDVSALYQRHLASLYRDEVDAIYALEAQMRKGAEAGVAEARERLEAKRSQIDAARLEIQQRAASLPVERNAKELWTEFQRTIKGAGPVYFGCVLLLWVFYAAPLWIRALSHRGPYEHMVDMENELARLRRGVLSRAWSVQRGGGEQFFKRFLNAEALESLVVAKLRRGSEGPAEGT